MYWKLKSAVQRWIARLPRRPGSAAYYLLQRRLGSLRRLSPLRRLEMGAALLGHLSDRGRTARGATFLEVGTGWRLNVPIALWLAGAEGIVTVDLNRYLKPRLVQEDLDWIARRRQRVCELLGPCADAGLLHDRLDRLGAVRRRDLANLLKLLGIRYLAPADATRLPLPSHTIDFHVSCTVLEHVPPPELASILAEGTRVLKRNGMFLHYVDFSDHFAHSDPGIPSIHFLRFSEEAWRHHAGNRFAYHNRMRVDDYGRLFRELGLPVEPAAPRVDPDALDALEAGFPLDPRFALSSPESNATTDTWLIAPAEALATAAAPPRRLAG